MGTNRGCSELVEAGDYKFHFDDRNLQTDNKFSEILHSFELTQHVSVATHKRNHTLDFIIITKSGDRLVQKPSQMGAGSAGYHAIRLFYRNLQIIFYKTLLSFSRKQISFRKPPCEKAHRYGRERFGISNALALKSTHLLGQNIKQAPFSNKRSPPLLITCLNCRDMREMR